MSELLTMREAAVIAGVTPHNVRLWLRTGRLPGWRKAGRLYVRRDDLLEFTQLVPVQPKGEAR